MQSVMLNQVIALIKAGSSWSGSLKTTLKFFMTLRVAKNSIGPPVVPCVLKVTFKKYYIKDDEEDKTMTSVCFSNKAKILLLYWQLVVCGFLP